MRFRSFGAIGRFALAVRSIHAKPTSRMRHFLQRGTTVVSTDAFFVANPAKYPFAADANREAISKSDWFRSVEEKLCQLREPGLAGRLTMTRELDKTTTDMLSRGRLSKAESFRLAYLWPHASLTGVPSYLRKFTSMHVGDDVVGRLTASEFVFVMYLAGVIVRDIPIAVPGIRASVIPRHIQDKAVSVMPELCIDEIGTVATALHMLWWNLDTASSALRQQLFDAVIGLDDSRVAESQLSISAILKLLFDNGKHDGRSTLRLLEKLRPHLPDLSLMMKARLIKYASKQRVHKVGPFVADFVETLRLDLRRGGDHAFRIKDLDVVTVGLLKLDCTDKTIYEAIMAASPRCNRIDKDFGRGFIYLNAFLAKTGVVNFDHLKTIFSAVNDCESLRNARTDDELLAGSLEVFALLGSYNLKSNRQLVQARELNVHALSAIAELDCIVEILWPYYPGPRLTADMRRKFIGIRDYGSVYRSVGRHDKMLRFFLERVEAVVGSSRVYYGPVLPFWPFPDFVLCSEKGGRDFVDVPERFVEIATTKLAVVRPGNIDENLVWHVVNLPKFDDPIGLMANKMDMLARLGYRPVNVPPHIIHKPKSTANEFTEAEVSQFLKTLPDVPEKSWEIPDGLVGRRP